MIRFLPVAHQEVASTDTEVLSALPGKPIAAEGLPGLSIESGQHAASNDFPGELKELLEAKLQQAAAGAEPTAEEPEPGNQGGETDRPTLILLAESWLQGMQKQQQAAVSARPAALVPRADERGGSEALPQLSGLQPPEQLAAISMPDSADERRAESALQPEVAVAPQSRHEAMLRLDAVASANAGDDRGTLRQSPAPAAALALTAATAGLGGELVAEAVSGQESTAAAAARANGTEATLGPGERQVAETVVRLQPPAARWGEQMLQALRQHVQTSLQQNVQQAHIRLDPPELGSLEIQISHEAGRLSVQIGAAQAEVARLLLQHSERLRQELLDHNFPQVEVQVFADGGERQQRHHAQPSDEELPLAAAVHDGAKAASTEDASDVLVTV